MKLRLLLLLVVVIGCAWFVLRQRDAAAQRREFAAVASKIAGRSVSVRCESGTAALFDVTSEDGYVLFDARGRPDDKTYLKHWVCTALGRFGPDARAGKLGCLATPAACPKRVTDDAYAVHVLTHESWHLRGITSEADTECHALHSTAWAAEQFGATPIDAALVQRYAWTNLLPRLPDEYHDPSCAA